MQLAIADVLRSGDLADVQSVLRTATFSDARDTAGWASADRKSSYQAIASTAIDRLRAQVQATLLAHPVVQLAAQPKQIIGPAFVRYGSGQAYGSHTDDPTMDGVRVDLSFTLFLTPPQDYDGGELVVESALGDESVKLAAGDLFLYPATTLHRVTPVIRGSRLVAVGWIRSLIRHQHHRDLLFDLETARRQIFADQGDCPAFQLISKSTANLVRLWCDD